MKHSYSQSGQINSKSLHSPLFFQNPGYVDGNTLLHLYAVECAKTIYDPTPATDTSLACENLLNKIESIGHDYAVAMSLITNDQGLTPLQLVWKVSQEPQNRTSTDKLNRIALILVELMSDQPYRPLKELLNLDDILTEASSHKELSPQLKLYLTIGTYLTNITRNIIKDSSSHPQFNQYTSEDQRKLTREIDDHRKLADLKWPNINNLNNVDARHINITQNRLGNCLEYSIYAFSQMRLLNFGIRTEIIYLVNGDHVLLLLGRAANSNINQPATWGDDAVICDAWSGKVYPAEDFLHQYANLYSFRFHLISKDFNAITSFNSRAHQIASAVELPAETRDENTILLMQQACSEDGYIYKFASLESSKDNRPPI